MHDDEEDPAALFRAAVGEVAPLRRPAPQPPATARPRPLPRRREPDTPGTPPRIAGGSATAAGQASAAGYP